MKVHVNIPPGVVVIDPAEHGLANVSAVTLCTSERVLVAGGDRQLSEVEPSQALDLLSRPGLPICWTPVPPCWLSLLTAGRMSHRVDNAVMLSPPCEAAVVIEIEGDA